MAENRPLLLFPKPDLVEKGKGNRFPNNLHLPSRERQEERLAPKFEELQRSIVNGSISLRQDPAGIEPEYALVFETVGDPENFRKAVEQFQQDNPSVDWLMELYDSHGAEADEDFYELDSEKERKNEDHMLAQKIFCISSNVRSLEQIISLWNHYLAGEKFPRGLTGFRNLFAHLRNIHRWGIQERFEETGIIDRWKEDLEFDPGQELKAEIELFCRSTAAKRAEAERVISVMIARHGGRILQRSELAEIGYHALLVALPKNYVQELLERQDAELLKAEQIMFIKPVVQAAFTGFLGADESSVKVSVPETIIDEPILAMFDGLPQENHPLLKDMLTVDDVDGIAEKSTLRTRVHGTSMASLMLHGQSMGYTPAVVRKIYVRPIMQGKEWGDQSFEERFPEEWLLVDKIWQAVRRMFEPEAGQMASSVRIINLSIGIEFREFYKTISPLARALDYLSYKYRILFIVSAGNHPDSIDLGMDSEEFGKLALQEKDAVVIRALEKDIRNHRLLSPAESINALTVGATFDDVSSSVPVGNMMELCSRGLPAYYSSFGRGVNRAVKPDILFPGGRNLVHPNYAAPGTVLWRVSSQNPPGVCSATPTQHGNLTGYSTGTSNSAALVSHEAVQCYEILEQIFLEETGEPVPPEYAAVLIKAMLVHGSSWGEYSELFQRVLELSGQKKKNELHQYLGYGTADIEKVKQCTRERITLIGYGDIAQNQGYVYELPIPIDFHQKRYRRRLTITLACLVPIRFSSAKYREKRLWLDVLNDGTDDQHNLFKSRQEYDYNTVRKGTMQHEIFEEDRISLWKPDQCIRLKVNCAADADDKNTLKKIPYALFATFEMEPGCDIDVYGKVSEEIRIRNGKIASRA